MRLQTAREAIQVRDEVLSIVAHDLRNPLGTILMQTALLQRRETTAERTRKGAEVIERAASRMNRLIHDLLDVTRLEAGRLAIETCTVAPRSLLSDAMGAIASAGEDKTLVVDANKRLTDVQLAPNGVAIGFTLDGKKWTIDRAAPSYAVTGATIGGRVVSLGDLATAKSATK